MDWGNDNVRDLPFFAESCILSQQNLTNTSRSTALVGREACYMVILTTFVSSTSSLDVLEKKFLLSIPEGKRLSVINTWLNHLLSVLSQIRSFCFLTFSLFTVHLNLFLSSFNRYLCSEKVYEGLMFMDPCIVLKSHRKNQQDATA
jgi:hypothetical protein